jgi:hypothetical protein
LPSTADTAATSQPSRAVALLLGRKSALEAMIAERLRVARERGTTADVRQLSASLRQAKASLKAAKDGRQRMADFRPIAEPINPKGPTWSWNRD